MSARNIKTSVLIAELKRRDTWPSDADGFIGVILRLARQLEEAERLISAKIKQLETLPVTTTIEICSNEIRLGFDRELAPVLYGKQPSEEEE